MVATLKTSVVQEPSSGTANLTLDASGGVTVGQNLTVAGTTTFTGGSTFTGNATAAAFIPSGSTIPTNGLYLPAANSAGIATNSTERLRIDSSGNVGIGTSSPGSKLDVVRSDSEIVTQAICSNANKYSFVRTYNSNQASNTIDYGVNNDGSGLIIVRAAPTSGTKAFTLNYGPVGDLLSFDTSRNAVFNGNVGIGTTSPSTYSSAYRTVNAIKINDQVTTIGSYYQAGVAQYGFINSSDTAGTTAQPLVFSNGANVECMRIDSSGNLLVGGTTSGGTGVFSVIPNSQGVGASPYFVFNKSGSGGLTQMYFQYNGSTKGSISYNDTATSFNTTSDYRLKQNIQPMQNALATVSQLNPVTYIWKENGSAGQGFIAHELQAVVPDCVTGEKDAVDENGKPIYQGVDTSFLVATLVKAIQELKAELDALKTKVGA